MGAEVGDPAHSAPSTIGESTIQQTGVTRKQGSLLGCEKHLLKLPASTGDRFLLDCPQTQTAPSCKQGWECVFLCHSTMPACHSDWSLCAAVPRKVRNGHSGQLQASPACAGWNSALDLKLLQLSRGKSFIQRKLKPDTPHPTPQSQKQYGTCPSLLPQINVKMLRGRCPAATLSLCPPNLRQGPKEKTYSHLAKLVLGCQKLHHTRPYYSLGDGLDPFYR